MLAALGRNWWAIALRGLFAILFGIAAFIWPDLTLLTLIWLFAGYAIVDGIFNIVAAVRGRAGNDRWWVLLLEGLLGIAAGVIAFIWPGITAVALLFLIAAWAIVTGILEIIAAVRLRKEIEGEWLLVLGGLASIVFGVLLAVWPAAGLLSLIWLIASFAIVIGILLIALAFEVRGRFRRVQEAANQLA